MILEKPEVLPLNESWSTDNVPLKDEALELAIGGTGGGMLQILQAPLMLFDLLSFVTSRI